MGKVDKIIQKIDTAKEYIESAGEDAERFGDKEGARKCNETKKKIDELREDFSRRGK